MKRRNAKWNPCRLLIGVSLLSLTACADTKTIKGCPAPIWPDRCAVDWLARTETPQCFDHWLDHIDRQQTLLERLK